MTALDTRAEAAVGPPLVTRRTNLVTALLASIITAGTTLDLWAHARFGDDLETFFTPWHGLVYTGLILTAAWIGLVVMRHQERGAWGRAAIPAGYGLGLAGAAIMAAGGVADLAWHTAFGIEVDLEALVSPPHLLLTVGDILLVSTPLREAFADSSLGQAPRFAALFPAVLSATLATLDAVFPVLFVSPLLSPPADASTAVVGMVLATLVLVGALLLMLRRWRLPFGSATLLFGLHAILFAAVGSFAFWPPVLPALAAGLAADTAIRVSASPRVVAGVAAAILWSGYILLLWTLDIMTWSLPLWTGMIAVAAGAAVLLALVTTPALRDRGSAERNA